jgi:hypothetical protein
MRGTLLGLLLLAATADARTLYWRSLDVEAKLDREGELRVSERHTMVFDGDWNGGERNFRVAPGQQLQLISISRIDPQSGQSQRLFASSGSIGLGQHMLSGTTLRWRARRTNDPPFSNQELTYVIDYALRNIVERRGDAYALEHDFAFAERPGVIEAYSLKLDLDPVWQPGPGFTPAIERANLAPGQSVIFDLPLKWTGEGQPQFIANPRPRFAQEAPVVVDESAPRVALWLKLVALTLFLAAAAGVWSWFHRAEMRLGRFQPPAEVTREWLEQNLLVHRAEVVGAAWDNHAGQAEVAALIAIMTGEGKIENQAGAKPRLRLLVPRASLSDYERAFVDRLFIAGDEIDPDTLGKHYRSTGFDPADTIRGPLYDAAQRLVGRSADGVAIALGCFGFVAMFVLMPAAGWLAGERWSVVLGLVGILLFGISIALTTTYQSAPRVTSMLPAPLILFGAVLAFAATTPAGLISFLAADTLLLWIVLRSARWQGTGEELMNLRAFRIARNFLRRRLEHADPKIEERWIPYIIAFGLGPELDRWFVSAPRTESTDRPSRSVSPSPSIASSSSGGGGASAPVFVAAGGRFGGAGATGGWASSISSFAAAVPAPAPTGGGGGGSSWSSSSSSSSSSRSSGGSRSGGGGGGGW